MPRLALTTATIGVLMALQAARCDAGELEEMRAMLLEMQQRLQQQSAAKVPRPLANRRSTV